MAWANITAYSAADLAKGKAEIIEVTSLIEAKIAANKHRNGKFTDEEMYAMQFVNSVLAPRAADFSVRIVGAAIVAATYAISGDDTKGAEAAVTEANVVVEIKKIIDALELDDCSYTLAKTTYTAADTSNNGSYKFEATVSKAGKDFETAEVTATISKLTA